MLIRVCTLSRKMILSQNKVCFLNSCHISLNWNSSSKSNDSPASNLFICSGVQEEELSLKDGENCQSQSTMYLQWWPPQHNVSMAMPLWKGSCRAQLPIYSNKTTFTVKNLYSSILNSKAYAICISSASTYKATNSLSKIHLYYCQNCFH